MNQQPPFAPPFKVVNNCLFETRSSRQGSFDIQLCNFVAWVEQENILDDGRETTSTVVLRGIHASGEELPAIEIPSEDLAGFNWVCSKWGIRCILGAGSRVKESLRIAIQQTAVHAPVCTTYTTTGWHRLKGKWQFLMPGDEVYTVQLPGKLQGYFLEGRADGSDLEATFDLLLDPVASEEVTMPLLALVFLSPMNHFLRKARHEPKFVVMLHGRTGARKSTIAALMLSFFGDFTASSLPLSFRDTKLSIVQNVYAVKDILTCIDDFYPAERREEMELTTTAQAIIRSFGDRQGRGRLTKDCKSNDARPPQGNAIITAEHLPNLGASGAARSFALELEPDTVRLPLLTEYQHRAARGVFRRCMRSYVEWMQETYLFDGDAEQEFVSGLERIFESKLQRFQESGTACHGRLPEISACLELGLDNFLVFLNAKDIISEAEARMYMDRFHNLLLEHAARQMAHVEMAKPTHIFLQKLNALVESGRVRFDDAELPNAQSDAPLLGYEDELYLYTSKDEAHRQVSRLCTEQNVSFTISPNDLVDALVQEGIVECLDGKKTPQLRLGGSRKRVMRIRKSRMQEVIAMYD